MIEEWKAAEGVLCPHLYVLVVYHLQVFLTELCLTPQFVMVDEAQTLHTFCHLQQPDAL